VNAARRRGRGTDARTCRSFRAKGHLVITERHPGFCRHQVVELGYLTSAHVMTGESVAFNVQPRITGQVLLGRRASSWGGTRR
jgi:hypothetical protein